MTLIILVGTWHTKNSVRDAFSEIINCNFVVKLCYDKCGYIQANKCQSGEMRVGIYGLGISGYRVAR